MATLTNEIISWLKGNGANVVGIANVERFEGAPRGHHPSDFIPKAKSVITFGIAILHYSINWEGHLSNSELVSPEHRQDFLQTYFYRQTGYHLVNDLLNQLALRASNWLEDQGYRSLFFPPTWGPVSPEMVRKWVPSLWGMFSQRHAAVLAGLGEFGLSNIVLTPRYGSGIRFNSVITEAELVPSELLTEKLCQGESCSKCIDNCPGPLSLRDDFDPDGVWLVTPSRTDIDACIKLNNLHYCKGRCIKVCPVGEARSKC